MGVLACGHSDDIDRRGGRKAAFVKRSTGYGGGRGNLSASLAAVVALRDRDAATVSLAAALPGNGRCQDAIHHWRRWFGRGRKVYDGPCSAGSSGALDARPQGRSRND